jgi:hypothetical protein
MNRTWLMLGAGLAVTGAALVAQAPVPELAFDTSADFLRTPPDTFVGEVGGVGANSKGQLFVYAHQASVCDARRQPHLLSHGSRLFSSTPAAWEVRARTPGRTSTASTRPSACASIHGTCGRWMGANQVVKFDTEGKVALVLGQARRWPCGHRRRRRLALLARVPGPDGRPAARMALVAPRRAAGRAPGSTFFRPSDVAWDAAGNIYIADGMSANNRIAKFDKGGRFIRQWGATGSQPGEFRGVKALAIDATGNVYAADYGNRRIQVFDGDGKVLNQFGNIGTPLAMCITKGATQHLFVSHSGDPDGMEDAAIYKVALDGTVVGKFGSAGKLPKQFGLANSLDCRSEAELLVGEMTNWRVQRITLKAR